MTDKPVNAPSAGGRLLSLDILRGLTVAGMILVNNGYGESFATLRHSQWNGMTPCDLVFPFFLFIMGISCYLSMSKSQFKPTPTLLRKIAKRTILLFAIGLAINWFEHAIHGDVLCFGHLRVWAVMQRIALCYFFVSLFALYANHRYTLPVAALLLIIYTVILLLGNGYAEDASINILAQADLKLFGYDHLYHKSPVDPEGLVATIASVAHVMLGFYCGKVIKLSDTLEKKLIGVFAFGALLVIGGYLLSFGLPLNKRIWSPSYVLATCGLAALLQALIMLAADYAPEKSQQGKASRFPLLTSHISVPRVFGVNALALYVASELLAIIFSRFGINDMLYGLIHAAIAAPKWASLVYALSFVAINYVIGLWLYKKKIFIKL